MSKIGPILQFSNAKSLVIGQLDVNTRLIILVPTQHRCHQIFKNFRKNQDHIVSELKSQQFTRHATTDKTTIVQQ